MKADRHINIGNIIIACIMAVFLYFISGSAALGLKDRFYPIVLQNPLIKAAYFAMILTMFASCFILFICAVLLWKYEEP